MNIVKAKLGLCSITRQPVSVIVTGEDGKIYGVPFDPANTDYQAYLAWLEAGNVSEPADEVQQ